MSFSRNPSNLSDVLKLLIEENNLESVLLESKLPDIWKEIVGESIEENVKIIKVKDSTLFLSSTSSAWKAEIILRRQSLINQINEKLNYNLIKKIYVLDK